MSSSSANRAPGMTIFGSAVASVALTLLLNVVAFFNGNTYTNGTAEATTMSGATVTAGGGLTTLDASLLEAPALSGGKLTVNKVGSGTGYLVVSGSTGGALCVRNTAGTMKVITVVTATLTLRDAIASDGCSL